MTFKVEQSGWYRTRDGSFAEVLFNKHIDYVPGFFENSTIMNQWDRNGRHAFPTTPVTDPDLVEYLGKERPKEPTRVADYFVQYRSRRSDVYFKQTHPIGSQPEGSVMVPGSERNATE